MGFIDLLLLAGVLAVLAGVPSVSVVLVVTRSMTHGLSGGAAAAAGVVTGDLVFVVLSIAGLSAVAAAVGEYFVIVRYLAAAYLIWFGVSLLWSRQSRDHCAQTDATLSQGYLAGLLLTLADVKAVFFYASLFPAFVDVEDLGWADATLVVLLTVATVAAVKLAYVFAAHQVRAQVCTQRSESMTNRLAGSLSVGAGILVMARGQ